MAGTLYIIGNGFDLHHKLNTSYSSFREYARKKQALNNWLHAIYGEAIDKSEWWWQFEANLAKVDYVSLMKSLNGNGNAIGSMEVRNLLNNLPTFFKTWLNGININVAPDKTLKIDPKAQFFSFNYTLLLEKIYNVPSSNVWHIHNSLNEKDKKLIVGHDSDYGELFKQFLAEKEKYQSITSVFADNIRQELKVGAKNVRDRIFSNSELFYKYSDINHYIGMGFSFNDIDMPYIQKIVSVNKTLSDAKWTIFCYSENDIDYIKKQLSIIKINIDRIELRKW